MPNGHAGDDWFTDIVFHGLPTFSPKADDLIKEIAASDKAPRPQALIGFVEGFLTAVSYEELGTRNEPTVGMEYRQLREGERERLEEGLRHICDMLKWGDGI
jgi:hypothetical protein